MLMSRNLDDQSFEGIVSSAVGRLPWLCPPWTDHNAHDPGITILELMAWYKEMQQYHMNQLTPELKLKLLKLAGIRPHPTRAAVCAVEICPGDPGRRLHTRLTNREEIIFELCEPIASQRAELVRACVRQQDRLVDVWEMLSEGKLTFQPFMFGGADDTQLLLGFSVVPEMRLRLWFEVVPPEGVPRNPFAAAEAQPRLLEWTLEGFGTVIPAVDETHALSVSGYVTLDVPEAWGATEPQGLRWLRVSLLDRGCEENVRLSGVSNRRYRAVQRETRAQSYRFAISSGPGQQVVLGDAMAQTAELAVFLRQPDGWTQIVACADGVTAEGRQLALDGTGAADDGRENLLVACLDPLRRGDLLLDASGRPGETLHLNLGGQTVLTEEFSLLCHTLDLDGKIRPMPWHCVEDLYRYGPRDRVFTYHPIRETITFGDGLHGAVVPRGKNAILITDMILSYGGGGNIPADAGLFCAEDGTAVQNGAAFGGTDCETVEAAAERLLQALGTTDKCVTAGDYEKAAKATPGLRVAAAEALPGYDPGAPTTGCRPAVVTVVVIPDSEVARPLPDRRFLDAVQRQLEKIRPVCTRVLVIAPRYVEIIVSAQLWVRSGLDGAEMQRVLARYFSADGSGIGDPIRKDFVAALLQQLPGVLRVKRLELRAPGPDCYRSPAGDIRIPPDAVPYLRDLELDITRS